MMTIEEIKVMTDSALLEYWCNLWESGILGEIDNEVDLLVYEVEYNRVTKEIKYRGGLEAIARRIK